jgi:hypothetical protein
VSGSNHQEKIGLLVTCLFKLGFNLLDKLPEERRAKLAQRIHERAYSYLASEAGAERADPLASGKTTLAANHNASRPPSPRPRR